MIPSVPKPTTANSPIRVKAKTARNLRSGPGTEYPDQGKPNEAEIERGDEIIFYDQPPTIAADGTSWRWCEVKTGKYAGTAGWFQLTNFQFEIAPDPVSTGVIENEVSVVVQEPKTVTTFIQINVTRVLETGAVTVAVSSDNEPLVKNILDTAQALEPMLRVMIAKAVQLKPYLDGLGFSFLFSGKENPT